MIAFIDRRTELLDKLMARESKLTPGEWDELFSDKVREQLVVIRQKIMNCIADGKLIEAMDLFNESVKISSHEMARTLVASVQHMRVEKK